MRRKVSTTVYLDQHQIDELKLFSASTKVPVAEYIRQAIDAFLADKRGLPGRAP